MVTHRHFVQPTATSIYRGVRKVVWDGEADIFQVVGRKPVGYKDSMGWGRVALGDSEDEVELAKRYDFSQLILYSRYELTMMIFGLYPAMRGLHISQLLIKLIRKCCCSLYHCLFVPFSKMRRIGLSSM